MSREAEAIAHSGISIILQRCIVGCLRSRQLNCGHSSRHSIVRQFLKTDLKLNTKVQELNLPTVGYEPTSFTARTTLVSLVYHTCSPFT